MHTRLVFRTMPTRATTSTTARARARAAAVLPAVLAAQPLAAPLAAPAPAVAAAPPFALAAPLVGAGPPAIVADLVAPAVAAANAAAPVVAAPAADPPADPFVGLPGAPFAVAHPPDVVAPGGADALEPPLAPAVPLQLHLAAPPLGAPPVVPPAALDAPLPAAPLPAPPHLPAPFPALAGTDLSRARADVAAAAACLEEARARVAAQESALWLGGAPIRSNDPHWESALCLGPGAGAPPIGTGAFPHWHPGVGDVAAAYPSCRAPPIGTGGFPHWQPAAGGAPVTRPARSSTCFGFNEREGGRGTGIRHFECERGAAVTPQSHPLPQQAWEAPLPACSRFLHERFVASFEDSNSGALWDVFAEGRPPPSNYTGSSRTSKAAISAMRDVLIRDFQSPPAAFLPQAILSAAADCRYEGNDAQPDGHQLGIRNIFLAKLMNPHAVQLERASAVAIALNPTLIQDVVAAVDSLPTGAVGPLLYRDPSFDATTRALTALMHLLSVTGEPAPALRAEHANMFAGFIRLPPSLPDVLQTLGMIRDSCPGHGACLSPVSAVYVFAVVESAVKSIMQTVSSRSALSYEPYGMFLAIERIGRAAVEALRCRDTNIQIDVAQRLLSAETGTFGRYVRAPPAPPAQPPKEPKRSANTPAVDTPPAKKPALNPQPLFPTLRLSMRDLAQKGLRPPALAGNRPFCLRYQCSAGCPGPCTYLHELSADDLSTLASWVASVTAAFPTGFGK
jgi:hypothetical protein